MLVVIILLIVLTVAYFLLFKIPKIGNMTLVTGGIKTGKTWLAIYFAKRLYRRQLVAYYLRRYVLPYTPLAIFPRFRKKPTEKPLFYSNIPLRFKHVRLKHEHIRRTERLNYGSVCFVCETSLLADSMEYKDKLLNEQIQLFCKLYGHETRGGYLVMDTQSIDDNHYSVKRCLSTYYWIHHVTKIPLLPWAIFHLREMHAGDGETSNTFEGDVEQTLERVLVPKSIWRQYDRYCYSAFTDDLPHPAPIEKSANLRCDEVITFRNFQSLNKYVKKE